MSVAALFAAALISVAPQDSTPSTSLGEPVEVEDIIVNGRRFEEAAARYVGAVANPAGSRGLARWRSEVCVSVANLQPEAAQHIIDRISAVAIDLGLTPGDPGCNPNIIISVTDDPSGLAASLVGQSFRSFHTGGSGTDQGRAKLNAFIRDERPVRWWHLSYPGNAETGELAVRLPGFYDAKGMMANGSDVHAYAPAVRTTSASRIRSAISDFLSQVIIIVDTDEVGSLSLDQLSDYLSMVAFAQIDPAGQTREFSTILNLFDETVATPAGLTSWDKAYLSALYQSDLTRIQIGNQRSALAAAALAAKAEADQPMSGN